MRVVVKEPGKPPEVREIGEDLKDMQRVVAIGQYDMIELVRDTPDGLDLWANEEGKYATDEVGERAEPNLVLWGGRDFLMGTAFMAGSNDEGESISLTDEQVNVAIRWFLGRAVNPIQAAQARAFAEQF